MGKVVSFVWVLLIFSLLLTTQDPVDAPESMHYNVNIGETRIYNCTKHIVSNNGDDYGFVELDDFSKSVVTNGTTFFVKVTEITDSDIFGVREYGNQSYPGSIAHFVTKVAREKSYYEELIAQDVPTDSVAYTLINDTFYRTRHEGLYATGNYIEDIIQTYGWNWKTGWLEYEYQKYSFIKTGFKKVVEVEFIAFPSVENLSTTTTIPTTSVFSTPTTTPPATISFTEGFIGVAAFLAVLGLVIFHKKIKMRK